MQNITKNEIQELLTIIPRNYPSHAIFHLTDGSDTLCQELYEFCKTQNYQYDLSICDQEYFEKIDKTTDFKPQMFDFKKSRYNKHAKQYEFVFVSIDLSMIDEMSGFFKKLHAINKNGGKVLFIFNSTDDIYDFQEKLIKHNYVAVNPIENTFKNYQILSANKMHGWGN